MGEYASWRHIGEKFGGLSKLDHYSDGGKGYSPRRDHHVKWHADADGVVDRFHVTRESDRTHVYYLLSRTRPPALTTHDGGEVLSSHYRWVRGLRDFDDLADAFVDRVVRSFRPSAAEAKKVEDEIKAEEAAVREKLDRANAFMARRSAAFETVRSRELASLVVTVGSALKTVNPKTTLLAMKPPYDDHEEMLAAIETALAAGPSSLSPIDQAVAAGITNPGMLPRNPPAPTGQQIIHHGPPGHWEVKPLAPVTGGRPPGL